MRKIILSEFVSLDGFYAGKDGNLDWVTADDEHHHEYSVKVLDSADLLLFGGTTYELFREYWPKVRPNGNFPAGEVEVAERMSVIDKLVISKDQGYTDWHSRTLHEIDPAAIAELKNQPGKNIVIFGSGMIAQALINHQLIDEFHILTQPVALVEGKPLFANLRQQLNLKLLSVEQTNSGVVRHYYALDASDVERQNYTKHAA